MRARSVAGGVVVALGCALAASASAEECLEAIGDFGAGARAVAFGAGHAFVAGTDGDVAVLDLHDPTRPQWVASLATPGHPVDVAIEGELLFVVEYDYGLHVADVSSPAQPRELGAVVTSCAAQGLAVADELVYVAYFRDGIQVFDVADRRHPVEIAAFDTPGFAYGIAVDGDRAYVADFTAGVRILDVSRPQRIREVGSLRYGRALDVVARDNVMYVVDAQEGLSIIDVTQADAPTEIGLIGFGSGSTDLGLRLGLAGDRLFIARDQLWLVDVVDPTAAHIVTAAELAGPTADLAVADHRLALVTIRNEGVAVFTSVQCGGTATVADTLARADLPATTILR